MELDDLGIVELDDLENDDIWGRDQKSRRWRCVLQSQSTCKWWCESRRTLSVNTSKLVLDIRTSLYAFQCGLRRLWRSTCKPYGHMGRVELASLNRTENIVRYQAPPSNNSDAFSEKCAILFRISLPALARYCRSFQSVVCKTRLYWGSFSVEAHRMTLMNPTPPPLFLEVYALSILIQIWLIEVFKQISCLHNSKWLSSWAFFFLLKYWPKFVSTLQNILRRILHPAQCS